MTLKRKVGFSCIRELTGLYIVRFVWEFLVEIDRHRWDGIILK